MAKRIVWSEKAQNDRKNILRYWAERNKSKIYSKKLNDIFKSAIKIIKDHPNIGKRTDFPEVRAKIVRDYYIFYQEAKEEIYILRVWDIRQNPDNLKI